LRQRYTATFDGNNPAAPRASETVLMLGSSTTPPVALALQGFSRRSIQRSLSQAGGIVQLKPCKFAGGDPRILARGSASMTMIRIITKKLLVNYSIELDRYLPTPYSTILVTSSTMTGTYLSLYLHVRARLIRRAKAIAV
jgi:hypothetical protein